MTSVIVRGEPAPKKNPYASADRAFEEAQAARRARKGREKVLAWERAVKSMKTWTPSSAVEALTRMPVGIQQMYLLAEEQGLNRDAVQRFFPAVAPSTREAWAEFATPAVAPAASKPRQRKTS